MNYTPTKILEDTKVHLGIIVSAIVWSFFNALFIMFLFFLLAQLVLIMFSINTILFDVTIPFFNYMPLSVPILLALWVVATIYFYRKWS